MNGQLLKAEQLAERWQVEKSHVYRLTREGAIPAVKLGRYYRYRLDQVEAFELREADGADVGSGASDKAPPRRANGRGHGPGGTSP